MQFDAITPRVCVSSRAAFFHHRSSVSTRSTRAYTVLKSIGHASRFDADRQNRERARESSLSLSDFTDRSGLFAGKKQRDRRKRIKAVGVLGDARCVAWNVLKRSQVKDCRHVEPRLIAPACVYPTEILDMLHTSCRCTLNRFQEKEREREREKTRVLTKSFLRVNHVCVTWSLSKLRNRATSLMKSLSSRPPSIAHSSSKFFRKWRGIFSRTSIDKLVTASCRDLSIRFNYPRGPFRKRFTYAPTIRVVHVVTWLARNINRERDEATHLSRKRERERERERERSFRAIAHTHTRQEVTQPVYAHYVRHFLCVWHMSRSPAIWSLTI